MGPNRSFWFANLANILPGAIEATRSTPEPPREFLIRSTSFVRGLTGII